MTESLNFLGAGIRFQILPRGPVLGSSVSASWYGLARVRRISSRRKYASPSTTWRPRAPPPARAPLRAPDVDRFLVFVLLKSDLGQAHSTQAPRSCPRGQQPLEGRAGLVETLAAKEIAGRPARACGFPAWERAVLGEMRVARDAGLPRAWGVPRGSRLNPRWVLFR